MWAFDNNVGHHSAAFYQSNQNQTEDMQKRI